MLEAAQLAHGEGRPWEANQFHQRRSIIDLHTLSPSPKILAAKDVWSSDR